MFGFPFVPYPIQLELMRAIYDAIENRKIGIMESPTGTGKSLSIICSALTWLQDEERRQETMCKLKLSELTSELDEISKEEDWISAAGRKIEVERRIEELIGKVKIEVTNTECHRLNISNRLDEARKRVKNFDSSKAAKQFTASNKRKITTELDLNDDIDENLCDKNTDFDDLLPSESEEFYDGCNEKKTEKLNCLKIVYASRTHSQLEQFAKEVLKTNFRPRMLSVGSRQQLCINDGVRSLKTADLVNDRCNQLLVKSNKQTSKKINNGSSRSGCSYAHFSAIEYLADEFLSDASSSFGSVDSMVNEGKSIDACPYFSARTALSLCQLVLVPYNVLLHPSTREAWNLDLKNSVVIVDEAHNLVQTLGSIYSHEISRSQIDRCLALLKDYIDRFRSRLSPRNLLYIRQLQIVIIALGKLFIELCKNSVSAKVFTRTQFLANLDCSAEINFFDLIEYMDKTKLCRKLRDFTIRTSVLCASIKDPVERKDYKTIDQLIDQSKMRNCPKSKQCSGDNPIKPSQKKQNTIFVSSTPFYQLLEFFKALVSVSNDIRINFVSSSDSSSEVCFRFQLLNPIEKLKELVSDEVRSLLLIGGTMRPTELLIKGLTSTCSVPTDRIVEFSCGHIADKNNLLALSLACGPDKLELNITYANKESAQMHISIAQTIINLLRHIPNGVVCFFPSYSFLDSYIKTIKGSGHFDSIAKLKPVFIESRGESEKLWDRFCQAAVADTGACLMSVVNGRLSEGINFSDELGRCVFMVGMPYPNKSSIELKETIKYISENMGEATGQKYYENLCMQSVNQAIGRVIRHRNDYASIVLLDVRYSKATIENSFPDWIRCNLTHCRIFSEALCKIISFFKAKQIS